MDIRLNIFAFGPCPEPELFQFSWGKRLVDNNMQVICTKHVENVQQEC